MHACMCACIYIHVCIKYALYRELRTSTPGAAMVFHPVLILASLHNLFGMREAKGCL